MASRSHYSVQIARLKAACEWGALSRGRATLYAKLIKDLFNGKPHTDERIYAVNESFEITDIHRFWAPHTDRFPGIKDKICESLKSGPTIADKENLPSSSNRPRNDAFPFLLAGKLLAVGVEVLAVDGILAAGQTAQWRGDITIRLGSRVLDIQCKRPFTKETIVELAEEGAKQIIDAGQPGAGIVALDLSRTVRQAGEILPATSESQIHRNIDAKLTRAVPMNDLFGMLKNTKIIGFVVFGRIPVFLKETEDSPPVPFSGCMSLVIARPRENLLQRLSVQLSSRLSV